MQKRWLKIVAALIIIILFFIGGSYILNKKNTPDTPAFNHDFTKDFLVNDAETPEGFHLFESGTKKFKILFPENYAMVNESYYSKKGIGSDSPDTENIYMSQEGISPKENQLIKGINLFLKPDGNTVIDATLDVIIDDINAPDNIKIDKYEDGAKTVYYVDNIDEYHADDGSIDRVFYFSGLITDNYSQQAIYFNLRDKCFNFDSIKCEIDFEKEKKMGLEMMKSVVFY